MPEQSIDRYHSSQMAPMKLLVDVTKLTERPPSADDKRLPAASNLPAPLPSKSQSREGGR